MELREADTTDTERLRELARTAMTASYALSPQQLDAIVEEQFDEDRLARTFDGSETVVLVAESSEYGGGGGSDDDDGDTVAGLVEGEVVDGRGEVRWLFVDPEHRGRGIGTELFEGAIEALGERGANQVVASTLEANAEGEQFFERFGFGRVEQRHIEVGNESLVEHVYAEGADDGSASEEEQATAADAEAIAVEDLPDVESHGGVTTATAADGRRLYVDRGEGESGTERPFLVTYADEDHTERFGYYCANCGSLDPTEDDMGRIECGACGNTHAERSGEAYDDSYL
jgi:ribosomal protein S18 acetylase RimI-like enzyme/ribosomal protein S27AE